MKKVMSLVIIAVALICVVIVSYFGMRLSSAYDNIVQVTALALEHEDAVRKYPDSTTNYECELKVPYNAKEMEQYGFFSFYITYTVYPLDATYKSLSLSIRGFSGWETEPVTINSATCEVRVSDPEAKLFEIWAETTGPGVKLETKMSVRVTGTRA